uniref:50S ribosomal protein L6 n=1 Tax=Nephromyces sp. ex Molgula occidentalis TaxID=2544991 RepID=A0A5C1H8V1_9APIC|nr:50S ribosomal protein L6 [Nephromyces sp. ex Molgula occidentalis]
MNFLKLTFPNLIWFFDILDKHNLTHIFLIQYNQSWTYLFLWNTFNIIIGKTYLFCSFLLLKYYNKALLGYFKKFLLTYYNSPTFYKDLFISGLGYYFELQQNILFLNIGFNHKIKVQFPSNVSCTLAANGLSLHCSSLNKMILGLITAQMKHIKKIDCYKGKGIRYAYEQIKLKNIKKLK